MHPTKLLDLALTLEIIDGKQYDRLSAIVEFYDEQDRDLRNCKVERDRLANLAAIDIVEDTEILNLVDTAIAATPMVGSKRN